MLANQNQKSQKKLWFGILAITLPVITACGVIAGYFFGVIFRESFSLNDSVPLATAVSGFIVSTLYCFKIIFDLRKRGILKE